MTELNRFADTQEFYEYVRNYFTQPGADRAISGETGDCVYRTATGQACAVGCAIPDELYDSIIEGRSAKCLIENLAHGPSASKLPAHIWSPIVQLFANVDPEFIAAAQDAHDRNDYWVNGEDIVPNTVETFVKSLDER